MPLLIPGRRLGARCLRRWLLLLLACGTFGSAASGRTSEPPAGDARKTAAELQAVKSEIERVTKQVRAEQVERSRLSVALRSAEISVAKAREGLDGVRRDRADRAARRAALAAEKRVHEADLAQKRGALAAQLRAAYLIGPNEPLQLLLNQQDPARAGRMFVYYSYFGRARAQQIHLIEGDLNSVAQLDTELAAQDGQLAELETRQRTQLADLEQARVQRSNVLASVTAESNTHAQSLERLKSQQSGLERLLRELRRAMQKFPVDTHDAFARLRGQLAWPVSGKLLAHFGEQRAGGVKWDGVLVATERGAPVHAVYRGRVIYADWLPGLGLLTIVDHGGGYMSLYGHNERLYKAAGEQVNAGELLGAAGDSGGSNQPELYFEIRKGGKAVDPRPWFRAAQP